MSDTSPPSAKQGISTLGWIAIGCVGVLILAGILTFACTAIVAKKSKDFLDEVADNPTMAGAEALIRMNPELEFVDKDEAAQTITFRNRETGETVELDVEDILEGKFEMRLDSGETVSVDLATESEGGATVTVGDEGKLRIGGGDSSDLPDWVPAYPGVDVQVPMTMSGDDGVTGTATFETGDTVDEVAKFYEDRLIDAGFAIDRSSYEGGGNRTVMLTGETDDGRGIILSISGDGSATRASMNFSEEP